MRGLTVFLMILVNNGVGPQHFSQLDHSKWNGLTLCDLVFPFFLFIVGISVWLALGNRKADGATLWKVGKRTLILFLIGVALHAWEKMVGGTWNFLPTLRVWGVLQRIALCYAAASLSVLFLKRWHLPLLAVALLTLYGALLFFGNGYSQDTTNLACIIDRTLVGAAHLYAKSPIDPEGLMGTLSAAAHTLIGVCAGMALKTFNGRTSARLALLGTVLAGAGLLLTTAGFPLNKRIWSPTYVLVTCGLAILFLTLLIWVIDTKGRNRWCQVFQMFGLNALFLYVLSEMIAPIARQTGTDEWLFQRFSALLPPPYASLLYSLLFCALMALAAWALWKRRIFIKI